MYTPAPGLPVLLSNEQVADLLDGVDLSAVLAAAAVDFDAGQIETAPRGALGHGPLGKVTHLMAAKDLVLGQLVSKLVDYDPARPGTSGRPSLIGQLTYLAGDEVVFVAQAATFTAIRTAATAALAVSLLAAPEVSVATIFGAGALGRQLAKLFGSTRRLAEIRIVSRSGESARRLAGELSSTLGLPVVGWDGDPRSACSGAGIVVTATSAVDPILEAPDVDDGTVVAALGAGIASRRELSGDLVARANLIVVEGEQTAAAEAGDLILAAEEGKRPLGGWISMGELVRSGARNRAPGGIAVYKSVGASWQDLACARVLAQRLVAAGGPA
jgi:ornithine cyclodeaminase/alanine dehydrogenase-like protein (mu-crystallin family)